MAEVADTRVAVYIDFDNIVISRYDQVHGKGHFHKDRVAAAASAGSKAADSFSRNLADANVDIGAILDFAASFGPIMISRAYADWSASVNSSYRQQLVGRAVDLTQMFATTTALKNGADIRLAVDVIEDLFRIEELTHVVIVAGDSDYIALAQRSKRLGRYVVGIGVAGSYNKALAAACDEFRDYDGVPGVPRLTAKPAVAATPPATSAKTKPVAKKTAPKAAPVDPQQAEATELLKRALAVGHAKGDAEWIQMAWVATQMRRMDPTFDQKVLGFKSFLDFIKSRDTVTEIDANSPTTDRTLRLR